MDVVVLSNVGYHDTIHQSVGYMSAPLSEHPDDTGNADIGLML